MQVTFRGVRGSTPVSGSDHLVFGGETLCLDIEVGERRIILDAGTGLAGLGKDMLRRGENRSDILLTHYHVDHLIGLMSYAPLFREEAAVTVHAPILDGRMPADALGAFFDKPFFPMSLAEAGAEFKIRAFHPGEPLDVGGCKVATCALTHPGGACGYRIDHGGRSLAVVMDHEHGTAPADIALATFCGDADIILYDAAWDEDTDYQPHRGWGHSTWQAGLRLLRLAGAGRLICLHHAPSAGDALLLEREARLQTLHPDSLFARQGETIGVGWSPTDR